MKISDKKLAAFIVVAFFASLIIRFAIIDLRPLHHDEGVFAISFTKPIYEGGDYRYNPGLTYHGPFLYYIEAFSFRLFGVNEFALRFFSIVFTSGLILLLYASRKQIGTIGIVASALLITSSPILLYYSNLSSSHEVFLIFFELAAIISFFIYLRRHDKKYIYSGFVSLALMLTTKEASYAIAFLLVLFVIITIIFTKTRKSHSNSIKQNIRQTISLLSKSKKDVYLSVILALIIFTAFYTSFFKHLDNLLPTITGAIPSMITTSVESVGHYKPFLYYTELLVKFELPMLILALVGLYYFRKNIFCKFWAYLLVSTWLLFSAVAYKTPWNILHIMLPLVVVAGIGAQELYKKLGKYFIPIFAVALIYSAATSYSVNYIDHSGQFNQLAYVTTAPDFMNLVNRLYTYDKDAEIKVLSSDYWPLPWYLRDYKKAGYYGKIVDDPDADIIVVKKEDKEKLEEKLKNKYESRDYQLRYGVWLVAYYNKMQ